MKDEKKKVQATDPLEAAKIAVKPLPEPPPPPPLLFEPQPSLPLDPPSPNAVKKYRVVRTTTVSVAGNLTRVNEGDIVSESSYGPDGMRRLMESGVPLELI
jgi:hypothetical protein